MDDRAGREVQALRDAGERRAPARSGTLRLGHDGTVGEARGALVTGGPYHDEPAAWLALIADDLAELRTAAMKSDPLTEPRVVALPSRADPHHDPAHVELSAVAEADGQVLVLVRDVSARERAQAREAALATVTSDVAFVVRPDGIVVTATAPARRLLGPVEGRDLSACVVPDDRVRFLELLAAPSRRRSVPLVLRIVGRDGAARSLEVRSLPVASDELMIGGFDVTAAQADRALLAAHRAVLEHRTGTTSLGHALDAVARAVEAGAPGARAAVYVRRGEYLLFAAAPSLRSQWRRVARRLPVPRPAGMHDSSDAAHWGDAADAGDAGGPVPLPGALAVLAADQGYGAGWLYLSRAPHGAVVGAIVLVADGPRRFAGRAERAALVAGSELAGLAIAHDQTKVDRIEARRGRDGVGLSRSELMDAVAGLSREPIVAVLVHVQGLARINERFGYGEGDRLLDAVAGALGPVVRSIDLLGRLGGATFAVVGSRRRLHRGSDPAGVTRRLRAALPATVPLGPAAEPVAVAVVVVAALSESGEPAVQTLARAEVELAAERERAQVAAAHSDNTRETIAPEGACGGERR